MEKKKKEALTVSTSSEVIAALNKLSSEGRITSQDYHSLMVKAHNATPETLAEIAELIKTY